MIPLIKSLNLIPEFDKINYCDVFVETGFYIGETFNNMLNSGYLDGCKNYYSIELSEKHFADGKNKFPIFQESNGKFKLILGDSSIVISELIEKHKYEKMFFYLDAHFSGGDTAKSITYGECPVEPELLSIEKCNIKPIIIIDDIPIFLETEHANCNRNEWPTLEKIKDLLSRSKFDFKVEIDLPNSKIICY